MDSIITDDIAGILDDFDEDETNTKNYLDKYKNDSLEMIKKDAQNLLSATKCYTNSVGYASLNKMLALFNLALGKPSDAVQDLIKSHSSILRQHILNRSIKTDVRKSILDIPNTNEQNNVNIKENIQCLKDDTKLNVILSELPQEWYMLQLSTQYKSPIDDMTPKSMLQIMDDLHITILPTGKNRFEPFVITVPAPSNSTGYDICAEIISILDSNKSYLESIYVNISLYLKMREKQNDKMKTAVDALENTWLREWRILFMADPIENIELVTELHQVIDKLVLDNKYTNKLSKSKLWLLKKIMLGSCFLKKEEIALAVKYVLPENEKLADQIILSIYGRLLDIQLLQNVKRSTLVLIVDENIDFLPFESMEIIMNHPVTRFPSLHITYAIFKEHENTIDKGCKVIKLSNDMGTCIVNPAGNLPKMEKRIKVFMDYWYPKWKSLYNTVPEKEYFVEALTKNDILMYNGHGSGMEYLAGQEIEKLKVRAIVLLFGCCSSKLLNVGGRYPPFGISNQYLIASSPSLLGMLWEVTDKDIDKLTANFLSNWIPSVCTKSWFDIDYEVWATGSLSFIKKSKKSTPTLTEPEMLRALADSKRACVHYMTSAAVVVRGLPIRLE